MAQTNSQAAVILAIIAAALVGAVTMLIAIFALSRLHETWGKDLDYIET